MVLDVIAAKLLVVLPRGGLDGTAALLGGIGVCVPVVVVAGTRGKDERDRICFLDRLLYGQSDCLAAGSSLLGHYTGFDPSLHLFLP